MPTDRGSADAPCASAWRERAPRSCAVSGLGPGDRHPVLDGNVKRVLCRCHGIEGRPGKRTIECTLWVRVDDPAYVPEHRGALPVPGGTISPTDRRPIGSDRPAARWGLP